MAWCDGMEEPRLLIAPEHREIAVGYRKAGCILSLRHPQSGKPTCYFLMDGFLQEVHWFKQSYGSWFLGDYVCEDGGLYICTPVDPVFLFLPIFDAARMKKGSDQGMFRQLEEILYVDGYPGYQQLFSLAKDSMFLVCEVKEIGSLKFFRLDNSKVMNWLLCKVNHLKATLSELDKNYAAQQENDTLKDIVSILGEYLTDEPWLTLLCSHLELDISEEDKVRSKVETGQLLLDTTSVPSHPQAKVVNEKNMASTRKQSKKQKIETDSKNIKDMFRRAVRR